MDGKNSFILYCDIGQHLELLSDEDAGLLFKGIVHYADTGEPPQLPPMAAMAFSFIRAQIDRDQEKWNTTREKRRAAGKSGGLKSGESRQRSNEAKEANANKRLFDELPPAVQEYFGSLQALVDLDAETASGKSIRRHDFEKFYADWQKQQPLDPQKLPCAATGPVLKVTSKKALPG